MEHGGQPEIVNEKQPDSIDAPQQEHLSLEGILIRMDAIRKELASMQDYLSIMEKLANQSGNRSNMLDIVVETSAAFSARESTCQQQLRLLERIYEDYFSLRSKVDKVNAT